MLVLVVGPSGAGKDTLLAAARASLGEDRRFRFVRRVITRPADAGGEPHESVTEAEFAARVAAGGFALTWRAHGLQYGIPADITADLDQGRVVVANLSRAVIAEAAERFRVRVVEITAPAALLAQRLAARGREDADDLARRLARAITLKLPVERETILNDGTVEDGARLLVAALTRAASGAPPA
ncbi:MAG: phosphonate metabolism protein/1,5-bisphosphokinase (PRPP-forming) PhnN [Acetobacteraceae bacterium]